MYLPVMRPATQEELMLGTKNLVSTLGENQLSLQNGDAVKLLY